MNSSAEGRTRTRVLRQHETGVLPVASVVSPHGTVISYPKSRLHDENAPFEVRLADARFAGYEEGRAAAMDELALSAELARADAVRLLADELTSACREAAANRRAIVDEVVAEATTLAFELLELLVGEVGQEQARVRAAVARAVAMAPGGSDLRIRLNPSSELDAAELMACAPAGTTLQVIGDPAVEPGGCVAEVGACRIDAQVGPALERVRAVLGELRAAPRGTDEDYRPNPPPAVATPADEVTPDEPTASVDAANVARPPVEAPTEPAAPAPRARRAPARAKRVAAAPARPATPADEESA
jgi:flagellar assembly protein FliH